MFALFLKRVESKFFVSIVYITLFNLTKIVKHFTNYYLNNNNRKSDRFHKVELAADLKSDIKSTVTLGKE